MSDYAFRADPPKDADAPVIFLFHGTGGDENQFFDLAGQLLPRTRRVAPRGDVSEHGALRYFRRTGEGGDPTELSGLHDLRLTDGRSPAARRRRGRRARATTTRAPGRGSEPGGGK